MLPMVAVVHDVENSRDAGALEPAEVLSSSRVRPKVEWSVADLPMEEAVEEITVGLEDSAIDVPDTVSVEPEGRVLRAKLTSVAVGVLQVDDSYRFPFNHLCSIAFTNREEILQGTLCVGAELAHPGMHVVELDVNLPGPDILAILVLHPVKRARHLSHGLVEDANLLTSEE